MNKLLYCGAALIACAALPAAAQGIPVAGLQNPARILIDKWGVPHIYAASQDDAFFVQGYNAARDRLFQIDLWRRRGLGELSSVLGHTYLAQDQASRLFLYRGSMKAEWAAYGPNAHRTSARFVAGINAYIDHLGRNPQLLPFEFRQLGYQPAKWHADDVVRIRSHGLTRNLTQEFLRARVVCQAGLSADAVRSHLSPAWSTRVPEGLDPCLPPDALDVFMRATDTVRFGSQRLLSALTVPDEDTREGSNSWVLAPSRTATGRPMLASDPHRGYGIPSLRYIVHLNAPGMDIIGAGEPALPGISIGHNGKVAFGLTIFSIDQEDLYVYQTNPANPGQYRYKGAWENFKVVRETVQVRGRPAETVELRFTRHGPVIHQDHGAHRALAVRTAWTAPGMAPYFGSIDYMKAQNFTQFRRAMARWGTPAENQVYADTSGNIGWVAGGLAPVRPQWDGLMPVPGDGRYEWQGFLDGARLPHVLNPARGWFASANEMNLPAAFPYKEHKIGFEWPDNARARRISEVLAATPKATMDDMQKLQNDVLSPHARRLQVLLKRLSSQDRRTQSALRLLGGWNGEEHASSAAAALYEVWWTRHLGRAFRDAVLAPSAARAVATPHATLLMESLEQPALRFGADAVRKRDEVLLASLGAAWAEMESIQGPDPKAWQWGRLHVSYFVHPLTPLVDNAARAQLNVGPLARGGGPFTVNVSSYHPGTFVQTHGASFRMVLDVGNWDNSRAINTPGQSGDPASRHYRDLAASWSEGTYFPLLYSRDAVQKAATQVIELTPARH